MIDTVHCYFESIGIAPDHEALLPIWERSWRDFGWRTRVLWKPDATRHPFHDMLMAKVNKLPTINSRGYENACYRRHLAMELIGEGILTDYDVINVGFTPEMMPPVPSELETLDYGGVPCAAFGNKKAWREWLDTLLKYVPQPGEEHISDMTIFNSLVPVTHGICRNILQPGWEDSLLIHFHQDGVDELAYGTPRHKFIADFIGKQQCQNA